MNSTGFTHDQILSRGKLNCNAAKFEQISELKEFLLGTGGLVLAEASPYDRIWGIGLKDDDERSKNPDTWQGQNLLGFALMYVRDEVS